MSDVSNMQISAATFDASIGGLLLGVVFQAMYVLMLRCCIRIGADGSAGPLGLQVHSHGAISDSRQ